MSKNRIKGYGNGGGHITSNQVAKYIPKRTPTEEIRRREALPMFTAPSNGLSEVNKNQFPPFGFRKVRCPE